MLDLGEDDDDDDADANYSENTKINIKKQGYNRNYVIIKFGTHNIECLLKLFNDKVSRVYLPQIAIVTDEKINDEYSDILYDNRFITIIHENKNNKKVTISNIITYLWERENYYNERGNTLNEYSPSKIIDINDEINSFINILVLGISRAGKSTLINLLSRKLVSLESPDVESVTQNINEYVLERTITDGEKKFGKIGIKLIDTPGLKTKKDGKKMDFIKMVIELIKKKMKECEDSKDDIHLIYFVFRNENNNLEDLTQFFKFLQNLNKERIAKNKKKIPIIFIGNEDVGKTGIDALCKFLKKKGLKDLIDNMDNKKEKIDFSKYTKTTEEEPKNKINDFSKKTTTKKLKNNIIEVNLVADKKKHKYIYGLDTLLQTTLYYLKKNNPFNNFDKLEKMNENIQKYILKLNKDIKFTKEEEKDFINSKENIKNIILELSEENFLLNQLKNTDDIILKSRPGAMQCLYGCMAAGFAAGLIPIPLVDLPILYSLYTIMVIRMGYIYHITISEFPTKDLIKLIFGIDAKISKKEDDKLNTAANVCEKGIEATKVVGNAAVYKVGKEMGSELAMKVGKEKVKNWGARQLRFAVKGGRKIFYNEIKEVSMKESSRFSKLIESLIQALPSLKSGVEQGIEKTAETLGNEVGNIYAQNTVGIAAEKFADLCEKRIADYSTRVAKEAGSYVNSLSLCKVIPVIGSIIGGVFDCYGTYAVGKNAIKYFEDYIMRTLGADYIIRQKNTYINIFNYLEMVSNEDFEKFEFNHVNFDNY